MQYPDQLGRLVEFNFPPQRIISLVPSQTELLFDLSVADRVVGITKFCVHPGEWANSKATVGGTKNFKFDVIEKLKPDLIIGNKEENYEEGIAQLAAKFPVWMSNITDWESAMQMIRSIGDLVGEHVRANSLVHVIQNKFNGQKKFSLLPTLYLIWKKPWMAAGGNTFIDAVLSKIGLANCVAQERYPELSLREIRELSPQAVLLSSEPFPFRQKHVEELQLILPAAKIVLVDGEMFSWYGSRLLMAPDYFSSLDLET